MAWLNTLNGRFSSKLSFTLSALVLSSAALTGCNVGSSGTTVPTTDEATPAADTTTTTTAATTGVTGCTGSYIGAFDPPSHEVRIATRNRALDAKGYQRTGNEGADNAATGGGGVDGGMYLEGTFAFETDANCNVIKGDAVIFGYPFPISGTVSKDRTFTLSYLGPIVGRVNADNSITGELQHGGGEEYIHGVLRGTFKAGGHI